MKTSEIAQLKIGDTVTTGSATDATVYRVAGTDSLTHQVQIAAPYGRAAPRWVDIGLLQRATEAQKRDPHNLPYMA